MFTESADKCIRDKRVETSTLLALLRKEFSRNIPEEFPLITLNGTKDYISVYKNILFSPNKVKRSIRVSNEVFQPTVQKLERKPKHVSQNQYLKSTKTVKLTSFLLEYLNLKYLRADELRDYAQEIMYSLNKKCADLTFCKTPQDHIELYEIHAFSCMTPKSTYPEFNTWLKTKLYKDYGIWPSLWYSYNPHTQGVYLSMDKRGVARSLLIRPDTSKEFKHYYTPIYAESPSYGKILIAELRKLKFVVGYAVPIKTVFSVPAINIFKTPICALPFYDCIQNPVWCLFKEKEDKFYFSNMRTKLGDGAVALERPYEYKGYITNRYYRADRVLSRKG